MDQHFENLFRPVTSSIPFNNEILEKSHLPCSAVLTPYARLTTAQDHDDEIHRSIRQKVIPAGSIARCQSCGATINPCSPILTGKRFMCGLCGEVNDFQLPSHFDQMTEYEQLEYGKRYLGVNENQSMMSKFFSRISEDSLKDLPELNQHVLEFDCNVMLGESDRFVDRVSAGDCPPLWIALIDLDVGEGDGTSSQSNIAAICSSLKFMLKLAPSFIRFGMFVYSKDTLGVFDLTCRYPHLKHVPLSSSVCLSDFITPFQAFPSIDEAKMNIESAVRTLGDYQNSLLPSLRGASPKLRIPRSIDKSMQNDDLHPQPLEKALAKIYQFFEDCEMSHPGLTLLKLLNQASDGDAKADSSSSGGSKSSKDFFYAGGKIMTFLTSKDITTPVNLDDTISDCCSIGRGGFGGSCSEVGSDIKGCLKYKSDTNKKIVYESLDTSSDIEIDASNSFQTFKLDSDNETEHSWDLAESTKSSRRYSLLGKQGASLALAVEIFCLTCHDQRSNFTFSIPTLCPLSDRSGGSGPLLFDTSGHNLISNITSNDIKNSEGGTVFGLVKEVISRSPWSRPCAFGATLKIRTSKSFQVEKFENDEVMSRYTQKGIFGNCVSDFGDNVWHFGACDCDSTLAFDIQITGNTEEYPSQLMHDHPFTVLPCIQTAFAYTTIVPSSYFPCDEELGEDDCQEWYTVRKLRVFTANMDIAKNTEELYNTLDAEALAVVLYHKLITSANDESISEARNLGRDWLVSVLSSSYNSARETLNLYSELRQKSEGSTEIESQTLLQDRIIGAGSEMPNVDIFLAQGHEQLCSLPLLLFALLQCDIFRQQSDLYRPSRDARCAASRAMATMPPAALARCIAPRIDCWEGGLTTEATHQIIDLNRRALDVIQSKAWSTNSSGVAFVIDSSYQTIVWNSSRDEKQMSGFGSEIMQEVTRIARTYRSAPPLYILNGENESVWRFQEALIEDSEMYDGKAFYEWCSDIADEVAHDLDLN